MGAKGFVDVDGGKSSEDITSDVNKKLARIGSRCRRSLYCVSWFSN